MAFGSSIKDFVWEIKSVLHYRRERIPNRWKCSLAKNGRDAEVMKD